MCIGNDHVACVYTSVFLTMYLNCFLLIHCIIQNPLNFFLKIVPYSPIVSYGPVLWKLPTDGHLCPLPPWGWWLRPPIGRGLINSYEKDAKNTLINAFLSLKWSKME